MYRGAKPDDVKTLGDLGKIPLVPAEIFKQYPEPKRFIDWLRGISSDELKYPRLEGSSYQKVIDQLNQHGVIVTFSSGSSGRNTFTILDPLTLSRTGYFRQFSRHLQRIGDPESYFFQLGPNMAGSNWNAAYMEYNLHLVPCYKPERVYWGMNTPRITIDTFRKQVVSKQMLEEAYLKVASMLETLNEESVKGVIGGMPFVINSFLSFIEELGKRFTLGKEWILRTGGGWKRSEHEAIPQHFLWKKVDRVLGIPERNCRDLYAMTECTVIFPSCEGHYYHIPYNIVHPFILDDDLESLEFGKTGRFAFIDTLSHVYPGYIITGDRVKLLEQCPACDRTGPVISPPIVRVSDVEDRGCSNVVRKLLTEEATEI